MNDATMMMMDAKFSASSYLQSAIDTIDSTFGEGYSQMHPELIAAYMQTAAIEFAAASLVRAIEQLGERQHRHGS